MDVNASIEVVGVSAAISPLHLSAEMAIVQVPASISVVEVVAPQTITSIQASISPVNINIELGTVGPKGDAGTTEDEVPYDRETDHVEVSATVNDFYIGEAAPGTAQSAATWRIRRRRITQAGNEVDVSEKYADGVATFTKVWDDRLGYTY